MIRGYAIEGGRLRPVPDPLAHPDAVVWLDLLSPSAEEEAAVEQLVGIDVPTLDEMAEIEDSSRLSSTAAPSSLPRRWRRADTGHPVAAPVTFILAGPRSLPCAMTSRALRDLSAAGGAARPRVQRGETVLLGLLDAIIERLADLLELAGQQIEAMSREMFGRGPTTKARRTSAACSRASAGRPTSSGTSSRAS